MDYDDYDDYDITGGGIFTDRLRSASNSTASFFTVSRTRYLTNKQWKYMWICIGVLALIIIVSVIIGVSKESFSPAFKAKYKWLFGSRV